MGKVLVGAWRSALCAAVVFTALCGCSSPQVQTDDTPAPNQSVEGNQRDYDNSVVIAACLEERGWDVEVTPTGGWGIEVELPPEQSDAYRADYDECLVETGLDDIEMTPELASDVYDNNLRVLECLEGQGYSVEDPPLKDTFVTKLLENPDGDYWNPYSLVPEDEMATAAFACPQ
jgi:hypothetical protein